MNVKEITLRIRRLDNPKPPAPQPDNVASRLVLELIDPDGNSLQEDLPPDLKPDGHTGDYKTFRETFVKEAEEHPVFSEIGQQLLALLYTGQVGDRLKQLKRERKPGERFRVLFDVDTGKDNLALLPWELMF